MDTFAQLRASHNRTRKPNWLLLVVEKVDLYVDCITKAREWYSSIHSDFGQTLDLLQRQLGTDYFAYSILPCCSFLDPFPWNGEMGQLQITAQIRNAYLDQFRRHLVNYCG